MCLGRFLTRNKGRDYGRTGDTRTVNVANFSTECLGAVIGLIHVTTKRVGEIGLYRFGLKQD